MSAALVVRCVQAKRSAQQAERFEKGDSDGAASGVGFLSQVHGGNAAAVHVSLDGDWAGAISAGRFFVSRKSSNRRAYTFEDSVIFVHDVERCLTRLNAVERELVGRIALQEYTLAEAAELTGMSMRTVGAVMRRRWTV